MNTMARASAPRDSSACGSLADLFRIDLLPDGPVRQSALADFEAQVAVDNRHEVAPESPGLPAIATTHLEYVTEPACRDEADARAFAFEQRIGADRRAVHDGSELRERPEGLVSLRGTRSLRRRGSTGLSQYETGLHPRRNKNRSVKVPPTSTPTIFPTTAFMRPLPFSERRSRSRPPHHCP